MSSEPDTLDLGDLIDDIKARLDDLEAELDAEVTDGRTRFTQLTADLRTRIEALRGEEPAPELTRVQKLKQDFDDLTAEVEAEIEAGAEQISSLLADLNRSVRQLEQKIRQR